MTRRLALVATVLACMLSAPAAPVGAASSERMHSRLPEGVPPAALRPERGLPVPRGWPFPDAFPRTSGTGRLVGGALEWTDFIYDDHGALGVHRRFPVTNLAPTSGTYVYDEPEHANNGADIFRIGIGVDDDSTYWRVDWNTLVRRDVPIAEFAFDTDAALATGGSEWPGGAGVSSAGIELALIISGSGAWLVDVESGERTPVASLGGGLTVDMDARSFVVRIPREALEARGTWRVRVASGLANERGTGFEPVGPTRGALPGQPNVYNVGFRSLRSERERSHFNFWMERHQTSVLSLGGNVHRFHALVPWRELARGVTTPEPQPAGLSNRWYVSSIELGQGVREDRNDGIYDIRPNFLGRVQPYAVYVPSDYDGSTSVPLTWVLHSLELQHNQFAALDPRFLRRACEIRGSICATPLARGPDGWYLDEAELDFWEVWRSLAADFRLDPDRTVLSGYSMGGYGTYRLGMTYPDLFAKAVAVAAPPLCGFRVADQVQVRAGAGRCSTDGDTAELVPNARWLPYVIVHGALDELVPVTSVVEQAHRFEEAGLRYRFELYPTDDHFVQATVDMMEAAARRFGHRTRQRAPGRITYTWRPDLTREDLGIGPAGAYWIDDLAAWDVAPGREAAVEAVSLARPDPEITPVQREDVVVRDDAPPGVATIQRWRLGPTPPPEPRIELSLRNVRALAIDLPHAGIPPGSGGTVVVRSSLPTTVTLLGLARGVRVSVDGEGTGGVEAARFTVVLRRGTHRIRFASN